MRNIQHVIVCLVIFRFFSVLIFILTDIYLKTKFSYSIEFNGFTCEFFLIELSKILRDLSFFLLNVFVVYVPLCGLICVRVFMRMCAHREPRLV